MLDMSQFIQINDNLFLSKTDPDFVRKYAMYCPGDADGLFDYAQELEANGRQKQADAYYARAAKLGSIKMQNHLDHIEQTAADELEAENASALFAVQQYHQKQEAKRKRVDNWLKTAIVGAALLLLIVLLLLFLKYNFADTPANASSMVGVPAENQSTPNTQAETAPVTNNSETPVINEALPAFADESITYTADELRYIIALNAIARFKEERGEYPEKLESLSQAHPENWVSEIPTDVSYRSANDSFLLFPSEITKKLGVNPDVPETIAPYLLELHFYPSSNELAVMSGEKLLAVYPVAAGSTELPPTNSKVLSRVVEPNGEGSALGSKGLELNNNFAIHGTNDPETIGQNVTDGCLRLANGDIDVLYPYVSKGTPFVVKTGTLSAKPMFGLGLPVLNPGALQAKNEMTPDMVYNWKH